MGQENQKVEFQGQSKQKTKRRLFGGSDNKKQQTQINEIKEVNGFNYKLQDNNASIKVCQPCYQLPPPFLKTQNKPKYYEENHILNNPSEQSYIQKIYKQQDLAQVIPKRITYYNAWSLPTQKYLIKEKASYVDDDKASSIYVPEIQEPYIPDSPIKQIKPSLTYRTRGRQNLNIGD